MISVHAAVLGDVDAVPAAHALLGRVQVLHCQTRLTPYFPADTLSFIGSVGMATAEQIKKLR
ncbi:hypothetical protein PEM37_26465 [Streptomyces sp. AD681]|uniref:hypothetical protein n=1 Tax=Streptomyces sp. AD681 TaxID=3019069 RepID=UPI0022F14928|nr:hypothetical protein [Streptomyces sp. AD681]MDA5145054.1 hypothetical protein [Streptomyces sp. AD681]